MARVLRELNKMLLRLTVKVYKTISQDRSGVTLIKIEKVQIHRPAF